MTIIQKAQKSKTNNYASTLDQFLEITYKCFKEALARTGQSRHSFSKKQIEAFLLDKRKKKVIIEERAKYCAIVSDIIDIFAYYLNLDLKNKDENEIVATNVSKRIQNMNVFKIPTREDLIDIIVMLSIRPAEVRLLQINHYELNSSNILA
ncbi:10357_t:CDS:2 [Cetraspora pellucida]|uniref:10357_t:CDS:1 n=1 Tax=Cetraspora pellucida TaxID=1433469 RepID=A0A9N9J997_9GLOM|nr:10357_t:CDS:2 [Cetraspora pellucida]